MIRMMKIMLKIKIKKKYIYILKKRKKMIEWLNEPYEWSPLTITTTLRTNKTPITDKTLRGEESEKKNTYLLHPNYEKTTLSNMQRKHHVH